MQVMANYLVVRHAQRAGELILIVKTSKNACRDRLTFARFLRQSHRDRFYFWQRLVLPQVVFVIVDELISFVVATFSFFVIATLFYCSVCCHLHVHLTAELL